MGTNSHPTWKGYLACALIGVLFVAIVGLGALLQ